LHCAENDAERDAEGSDIESVVDDAAQGSDSNERSFDRYILMIFV